jgi:hypothetical protein
MLAIPTTMAPAFRSLSTAVESTGEIKSKQFQQKSDLLFNIWEAADVCIPFTKMLSFTAIGMPSRADKA